MLAETVHCNAFIQFETPTGQPIRRSRYNAKAPKMKLGVIAFTTKVVSWGVSRRIRLQENTYVCRPNSTVRLRKCLRLWAKFPAPENNEIFIRKWTVWVLLSIQRPSIPRARACRRDGIFVRTGKKTLATFFLFFSINTLMVFRKWGISETH